MLNEATFRPVVLLVDDDEEQAKLLREKFERNLYTFLWATSVEEAIKFVKEVTGYIVAFVDIKLGQNQPTGMEFFRYVDEHESHRVVTFGYTAIGKELHLVEMKALSLGAVTFFSKTEPRVLDRMLNYAELSIVMRLVKKNGEDELTGLWNYLGFKRQVIPEMKVARDRPDGIHPKKFALLVLHLKSYRECRDKYGYMAGNTLVFTLTELLRHNVRPTDHLCRNGDDEFLVWLSGAQEEDALEVGSKILELASQLSIGKGAISELDLQLQIGASHVTIEEIGSDADHSFEELVGKARRFR